MNFFEIILSGVVSGGLYALIAIGFNLQYGVARIFNLAYGEFLMVMLAEMAAFDVGKDRRADHAEFFDAAAQLFHAGIDVLLRQGGGAFDAPRVGGAILGEPAVARTGQRRGEAGVFQGRQRSSETGAEQHGDIDLLAIHVDQSGMRIGHAGAARVGPAVGAANANAETARARPGFAFDDGAQLTVAAVAPLGRLAFILFRQTRFPVDMIFFQVAVGVDGAE